MINAAQIYMLLLVVLIYSLVGVAILLTMFYIYTRHQQNRHKQRTSQRLHIGQQHGAAATMTPVNQQQPYPTHAVLSQKQSQVNSLCAAHQTKAVSCAVLTPQPGDAPWRGNRPIH